jgi:hypothetical protein
MAELLSRLRAIPGVEALEAAWPGITPLLRRLEKQSVTRNRSSCYRPMPVRDERDGSWCLPEPGPRSPRDLAWQELYEAIVPILYNPVFTDPRATAEQDRLLNFCRRIISTRTRREKRTRGEET